MEHVTAPDRTPPGAPPRLGVHVTDDGVEYQHMIHALDLTRKYHYEKSLLGGGPAQPSTTQR